MTAVAITVTPRARWLTARIAELDVDIAHLTAVAARVQGHGLHVAESALDEAVAERAAYRAELNANAEVSPC